MKENHTGFEEHEYVSKLWLKYNFKYIKKINM